MRNFGRQASHYMGAAKAAMTRLFLNRIRAPTAPPPHRSEAEARREAESVNQWMRDSGEEVLDSLLPLTGRDLLTVGILIQLFCYADFNARRILEIIDKVEGRSPTAGQALRDGQVMSTLAERLPRLNLPEEEIEQARVVLRMIDDFMIHRHNLAHWAARRVPHADALLLMTKNTREARRRTGTGLSRYEMQYAVVPIPELRANIPILQNNADWLAVRASRWWHRFCTDG